VIPLLAPGSKEKVLPPGKPEHYPAVRKRGKTTGNPKSIISPYPNTWWARLNHHLIPETNPFIPHTSALPLRPHWPYLSISPFDSPPFRISLLFTLTILHALHLRHPHPLHITVPPNLILISSFHPHPLHHDRDIASHFIHSISFIIICISALYSKLEYLPDVVLSTDLHICFTVHYYPNTRNNNGCTLGTV